MEPYNEILKVVKRLEKNLDNAIDIINKLNKENEALIYDNKTLKERIKLISSYPQTPHITRASPLSKNIKKRKAKKRCKTKK